MNEVITLIEPQFITKRITIERVDWPSALVGELREAEVKQIVHNLLLNACEASAPDAAVEVVVELDDRDVLIKVQDHGNGIPDEILAKLFEPFVTSRYESGRSGIGLGLSISKSLADALGGNLEAVSTSGQGAQLTLRLPFLTSTADGP